MSVGKASSSAAPLPTWIGGSRSWADTVRCLDHARIGANPSEELRIGKPRGQQPQQSPGAAADIEHPAGLGHGRQGDLGDPRADAPMQLPDDPGFVAGGTPTERGHAAICDAANPRRPIHCVGSAPHGPRVAYRDTDGTR